MGAPVAVVALGVCVCICVVFALILTALFALLSFVRSVPARHNLTLSRAPVSVYNHHHSFVQQEEGTFQSQLLVLQHEFVDSLPSTQLLDLQKMRPIQWIFAGTKLLFFIIVISNLKRSLISISGWQLQCRVGHSHDQQRQLQQKC